VALALGLLHVIISEKLYDEDFVNKWTVGFDKLVAHVKDFSPGKVEEITTVPSEQIEQMARLYATTKPFSLIQGGALEQSANGVDAVRALSIMVAVTGNFDVAGGNFDGVMAPLATLRLEERIPVEPAVTGARYPFYTRFAYETSISDLPSAILSEDPYPVRALIIQGSNPMLSLADANRLRRALEKLHLLVVMDLFLTDTAKLAHIFLPACSFLERKHIIDYGYFSDAIMSLRDRAIPPVGESLPDWQIWTHLARKLGYGTDFPWETDDELLEEILAPSGFTLQQLRDNPGGLVYQEREYQKYLRGGFQTPSGKVEIYSEALARFGYHPLPTYWEPYNRQRLIESYPLIMTTRNRIVAYPHSQFREVESLRKLSPEPVLEINPQTAEAYGIQDKDRVRVDSPQGQIELTASLNEGLHPDVLVMAHGWSEANANFLTNDKWRDPISGFPNLCSVPVRIEKGS
jgi:anaerobic selenocysteine-containing dehydrogenase